MRMGPMALFALALVAAGPAAAQSVKGDAAKGATLFKQRCGFCHSVVLPVAPGPAPNLKGVVGRKAASTDFSYSTALAAANLQWTAPNLDKFLTAPAAMVPGTFMVVSVPKPDERASIISYLASLK